MFVPRNTPRPKTVLLTPHADEELVDVHSKNVFPLAPQFLPYCLIFLPFHTGRILADAANFAFYGELCSRIG